MLRGHMDIGKIKNGIYRGKSNLCAVLLTINRLVIPHVESVNHYQVNELGFNWLSVSVKMGKSDKKFFITKQFNLLVFTDRSIFRILILVHLFFFTMAKF